MLVATVEIENTGSVSAEDGSLPSPNISVSKGMKEKKHELFHMVRGTLMWQ